MYDLLIISAGLIVCGMVVFTLIKLERIWRL